jgi:ketosteroid isomerase-like protein
LIDGAGLRHRIRGINVMKMRDGKLLSVRSYEDPLALETE